VNTSEDLRHYGSAFALQRSLVRSQHRPLEKSDVLRVRYTCFIVRSVPRRVVDSPRGVCQDQEPPSQGRGQEQGDPERSDRCGAIGEHRPRRSGLLRACRIPPYGSLAVKRAVAHSPQSISAPRGTASGIQDYVYRACLSSRNSLYFFQSKPRRNSAALRAPHVNSSTLSFSLMSKASQL
jgi:hypothetical protein